MTLSGLWDISAFDGLDTDFFGLITLNPAEIAADIESRGSSVEYWPSQVCPCARNESHVARADCKACYGMGWLYPRRMRRTLEILLASLNESQKRAAIGDQITGKAATCTFPTDITPKPGSLIFRRKQQHLVDELITHETAGISTSTIANLRGSALEDVPRQPPSQDLLRYPQIDSIVGIWEWSMKTANEALKIYGKRFVDLTPSQRERVREATAPEVSRGRYTLKGNRIVWRKGQAPGAGDVFSVSYRAPATFIIVDPPSFRADGDTPLPYKCTAVRYDSWGQGDRGSP